MNPIQTIPSYLSKIYFNFVHPRATTVRYFTEKVRNIDIIKQLGTEGIVEEVQKYQTG
jgi:hypothetical protein